MTPYSREGVQQEDDDELVWPPRKVGPSMPCVSQERMQQLLTAESTVRSQASQIEALTDALLQARNYAAGESPDVEDMAELKVFGMIVDLLDAALKGKP
jgi:hypothetical protein